MPIQTTVTVTCDVCGHTETYPYGGSGKPPCKTVVASWWRRSRGGLFFKSHLAPFKRADGQIGHRYDDVWVCNHCRAMERHHYLRSATVHDQLRLGGGPPDDL